MNAGLLSSARTAWATPATFFATLDAEFHFELDPCADEVNAKCRRFYTEADNGLAQNWAPARVFMNPPYGRAIGRWMKKALEESRRGALVVCLVPSRTDTAWWHEYAMRGEIRYLRGRLTFEGAASNCPFPCAVVIFQPTPEGSQ